MGKLEHVIGKVYKTFETLEKTVNFLRPGLIVLIFDELLIDLNS